MDESLFLVLCAVTALKILTSFLEAYIGLQVNGKMTAVGNASYLWKVLHLPMEFFSQRYAGDIYQRQQLNSSIVSTLIGTFAPLALEVIMMFFYLVVMIRYSVILTVIGFLSVIFNGILARIVSEKRLNYTRGLMRDSSKMESSTVSGLEMIESIKASGVETMYLQRWLGYQAKVNAQEVKYSVANTVFSMISAFISTITSSIISIAGLFLIMNGQFTIGVFTAFQGYLGSALSPAQNIISAALSIQEMRSEMERVEDVMNYPVDWDEADADAKPEGGYRKLRGEVEIRNLTFGYSPLAEPLIRDFNLHLEPGKSVAFVGASGSGKSTLSKLISGLYKPWEGEILFNSTPIGEINHHILTGSLAVVDQDITIFEDTIANNIRMWDNSIQDFEVILAARDAQIHEDIMQRQDGYAYKLQDGGRDLSGGQKQRLEIARVLAQDPSIVILDEATSALDAKTEAEVVQAIKERGITCIIIAHRLSTIRDSDEIVVMEKGKVVERGTHEELYARNGKYTALISNE